MDYLEDCTFFLGMCLTWNCAKKTITLHHGKYIRIVLDKYGMQDCRPCKTLVIPNTHLVPATFKEIAKFEATGKNIDVLMGCSTTEFPVLNQISHWLQASWSSSLNTQDQSTGLLLNESFFIFGIPATWVSHLAELEWSC